MAGFVVGPHIIGGYYEFHTDTPDVVEKIGQAAAHKRVVSFQLDGDELAAALWGIKNWSKKDLITKAIEEYVARMDEDVPVQQQLQYQKDPEIQCPNCFAFNIYELTGKYALDDDDTTHGCHMCGQKWRHDG